MELEAVLVRVLRELDTQRQCILYRQIRCRRISGCIPGSTRIWYRQNFWTQVLLAVLEWQRPELRLTH